MVVILQLLMAMVVEQQLMVKGLPSPFTVLASPFEVGPPFEARPSFMVVPPFEVGPSSSEAEPYPSVDYWWW